MKISRVNRYMHYILLSLSLVFTVNTKAQPNLKMLPAVLEIKQNSGSINIENKQITIIADKGTDLFTNANGSSHTDNAPRVTFLPQADFIFSTQIKADFTSAYDGAALILYSDEKKWAKLLFEQFKTGQFGIASTISRGRGDDVYHHLHKTKSISLKIVRRGDLLVFYSSIDGITWRMLRNFSLEASKPIKLGFLAQSPISEKFKATFSNIKFSTKTFTDFWQGQ